MAFSILSSEVDVNSSYTDLTSLPSVIMATTAFILVWSWIRRYVTENGPIAEARMIMSVNNKLYSAFSIMMAVAIARSVLLGSDGKRLGETCRYTYHFSKFYEYLDVLLLVASGVNIGPHMAFYHLTTPFLTYFRVLHASDWQLFAFLNCCHNLLLYSYFGGAAFLRAMLPYTGYLQLGAGIALDAWYLLQHGQSDPDEATSRGISILLLARYAQLFTTELRSGSQQEQEPKAATKAKKSN